MQNIFRRLRQNKPLLFGIYGAIGCLIAAIALGEPLLALTKLNTNWQKPPQAIVLLIDVSGSMAGNKIDEIKSAATGFVERRDLSRDRLALVTFGSAITTLSPLTSDVDVLKNAIASLSADGGTPMDQGINRAVAELQGSQFHRNILLFTDGVPDSQILTTLSAQLARNQHINIIAVGTGDADIHYLAQVTGNPSLVFFARSGQFDQVFRSAEALIDQQLVESNSTGNYGLVYSGLRIGGWTACLALGISLALIMGQNAYMHLPLLTIHKGMISTIGSLGAGMIAGATGQLLFGPLTSLTISPDVETIIHGIIASTIFTVFLSLFTQKVKRLGLRAIVAGGISGGLALAAWLVTARFLGDFLGRLAGGIILSVCIGRIANPIFGLVAGIGVMVFGQLLLMPISGLSLLEVLARMIGWTILGVLVGGGTKFFVPNLQLIKALYGGTLGGLIGAVGFLIAASVFGDILGRLSGAAILGFCIGWMIAFAEQEQIRQAESYLIIHWTPTEQTPYLLGIKPCIIGSSREANIPLNASEGFTPITAKIYQEGEKIIMQFDPEYAAQKNMKKTTQELKVGDTRKLGRISIEVQSQVKEEQTGKKSVLSD